MADSFDSSTSSGLLAVAAAWAGTGELAGSALSVGVFSVGAAGWA